jgi:HK97 family phage portal protein
MSFWNRLWNGNSEAKATVLDSLPDFMRWPEAKSGVVVNVTTALEVTTVFACARVLAEGVSQVPFQIMQRRREGKGADPATSHPLYWLLHRKPNFYQTSFEFRETLMLHLVLCGNAYVYKSMSGNRVLELIPLEPGRVTVERQRDLSLIYKVRGEDGLTQTVPTNLIWHIRGPSWNTWMGLEAIKLAREAIGLATVLETSHAEMHKNGPQFVGAYSVEGPLSPEQHVKITEWLKRHAKGDPLILDRGAKWLSQQMSGVDAQHLETRANQVEEICRALRVMPIMVGHSDKAATYASAEQMFIAHVVHSLAPWAERIEQSADTNLIADERYYALLDLRGMMRGALKDQAEYYAKALGSGGAPAWMTQDEVRDDLDLNPMGSSAAILREPSNVGAQGGANGAA